MQIQLGGIGQNEIPLEDRKTIWRLKYASFSFKRCSQCCDYILQKQIKLGHPLNAPLTTAAQVYYARPFLKNYGMDKLNETQFVPANKLAIHQKILDARNKVAAHVDATNDQWCENEPQLIVYLFRDGQKNCVRSSEVTPGPSFIREIRGLARFLEAETKKCVNEWIDKWSFALPDDKKQYRVSIKADGPGLIFDSLAPDFAE